ncbi:Ribosomal L29 family protein [Hibiscus syriacus]|uniref:Ribosomal L29 family protein n=1 Tax=Hibiscus syriacus TaxID=106335 RepID=A0A6A3BCV5_HIBSY|nr:Ribosomal L29 family protein [Hibiscus syriacus]
MNMDLENGIIRYDEEYILNSRGLKLFTCKWVPVKEEPKGLIFICHGYAMECSITMNSTAIRLVKAGFAVYGIDYEGHGKSSGLQGYISTFDNVVDDCSTFFTQICEKRENKRKMRILLGESMGGAVLLMIHRKKPEYWDGAVLVAPMCKVSLSFIVLHGEDDKVTDKTVSQQLYDVASSSNKTLKLYLGTWHGLLYGETPENIEIVFSDIIKWLNHRYEYGNSRFERENDVIFVSKDIKSGF